MSYPTELRTYINEADILDEDYIYSLYIQKLKEVNNMNDLIEQLKNQRSHYMAEVEKLKATDLQVLINERFELAKEKIAEEVKAEFDAQLAEAELKVQHYDFVIEKQEEMLLAEETTLEINEQDIVSDIEEVDEVPDGANVFNEVKIVEV